MGWWFGKIVVNFSKSTIDKVSASKAQSTGIIEVSRGIPSRNEKQNLKKISIGTSDPAYRKFALILIASNRHM